mmetsp:Transcript_2048/g.4099  ORF Transcript_2048/g.4099 Transcript_2048/m.4099 type:complete len:212 (-) Transcript_2048:524-1159(-)
MTNDPTNVACGPESLSWRRIVKCIHTPLQCCRIATGISQYAFRYACRPAGIQYVVRISRKQLDCINWLRLGHNVIVANIDGPQLTCLNSFSLNDYTMFHAVIGKFHCPIEQRLVRYDPISWLDASACRYNYLRLTIRNSRCKLRCSKSSKHDGMHGANACAGQHCNYSLWNHWHVDYYPIALLNARILKCASKARDLIKKLRICVAFLRVC